MTNITGKVLLSLNWPCSGQKAIPGFQKIYVLSVFVLPVLLLFLKRNNPEPFTDPRDNEQYQILELEDMLWFKENLRYRTSVPSDTLIDSKNCGVFYSVKSAKTACPEGWRLPTEKEVKRLVRLDKRGKISLKDTLNIQLCGRMDNEKHAKIGLQNTFWLSEELTDGHITHWHTFGETHKIHNHNVVVARRKFPVRCVCEIQ